jgi:hypothetical protein
MNIGKKVTRILMLTNRRIGSEEQQEKREEKGNEIVHFSSEDRNELTRWKVQLALKMAGKPRTFNTEQKKLRYAVERLQKVAMVQIIPYHDKLSGAVKQDSLKPWWTC